TRSGGAFTVLCKFSAMDGAGGPDTDPAMPAPRRLASPRRRALLARSLAVAAALVLTPLSAHAAQVSAITPATATFQVATLPAGGEAGWTATLVGGLDTPPGGEQLVSTGAAPASFTTPLAAGLHTVAQTTRTGW